MQLEGQAISEVSWSSSVQATTNHGTSVNIDDTTSHMPACRNFPRGSPFTKHESMSDTSKTWYTWVRLGKDKHGRVVWEHAHVLLAAARFGVPNTRLDPNIKYKDKHLAHHCPTCPCGRGGCCNPLHITWGSQQAWSRLEEGSQEKGVQVGRAVKSAPPLTYMTPQVVTVCVHEASRYSARQNLEPTSVSAQAVVIPIHIELTGNGALVKVLQCMHIV